MQTCDPAPSTKPCPACGKVMIVEYDDIILLSDPGQQRRRWWCACGHVEDAGTVRFPTNEESRMARWEAAQKTLAETIGPATYTPA